MFSYEFYKVTHLIGIFLVLFSVSAMFFHSAKGGTKLDNPWRKAVAISHGIGLVISFVAGFGLIARLGTGFQPWVYVKMIIWLFFASAIGWAYKTQSKAQMMWFLSLVIASSAAYLAIFKPI